MQIIKYGCNMDLISKRQLDYQYYNIKFMIYLILIYLIIFLDMIERINRMIVILKWEFNIELRWLILNTIRIKRSKCKIWKLMVQAQDKKKKK